MRLFVAVELGTAVRTVAEKAANEVRESLGRALKPKWVPSDDMHVTVRFIGHVADERVPLVVEALQPPLAIEPFDVVLGDCGAFPSHGAPRVLWIGLKEGLPSLEAMHVEFNRRLRTLGFEPENRPFSAHLTLARVKDAPRGSGAAVREAIGAVRVAAARCRVSEAVVFESRLSPKGSVYSALLRVPLRT